MDMDLLYFPTSFLLHVHWTLSRPPYLPEQGLHSSSTGFQRRAEHLHGSYSEELRSLSEIFALDWTLSGIRGTNSLFTRLSRSYLPHRRSLGRRASSTSKFLALLRAFGGPALALRDRSALRCLPSSYQTVRMEPTPGASGTVAESRNLVKPMLIPTRLAKCYKNHAYNTSYSGKFVKHSKEFQRKVYL